ncbi:MAG: AAA family ATPase, partial [Candidatus Devosia symbiotica]|nr:AAA family ATPase [Candidatus Devosia symbiotica]
HYFNRTLFQRYCPGALEGRRDNIKWSMIHWAAIASRYNGARYRDMIEATALSRVFCSSP